MPRPCSSAQVAASASDSPGSSRSWMIARAGARAATLRAAPTPDGRAVPRPRPAGASPRSAPPPGASPSRPRRMRAPPVGAVGSRGLRSSRWPSWRPLLSIARRGSIVWDDEPWRACGFRRAAIAGGFDSPSDPTQDTMKRRRRARALGAPSPSRCRGTAGAGPGRATAPPRILRAATLFSMRKADNGVGRPVFALPVRERPEVQVVLPEGRILRRAPPADGG